MWCYVYADLCSLLAATMVMRCVMRPARTPKFQLSGPTVHSYTVVQAIKVLRNLVHADQIKYRTLGFLIQTSLTVLASSVLKNPCPILHTTLLTLGQ